MTPEERTNNEKSKNKNLAERLASILFDIKDSKSTTRQMWLDAFMSAIESCTIEEREACAKVVDDYYDGDDPSIRQAKREIAKLIRQRKDQL